MRELARFKWIIEPLILFAFTVLATQWATIFARNILTKLKRNLDAHATDPQNVKDAIRRRSDLAEADEGDALESYLNQIIATWAFLWLITGQLIVMLLRPFFGSTNRTFYHPVALGAAILTLASLLVIFSMERFGSESLVPYLNRKKKIHPPWVALTFLRYLFGAIYFVLLLVCAAHE